MISLLAGAMVALVATTAAKPARAADPDTLSVGGGTIEITFDGSGDVVSRDDVRRYVRRAAEAATLFYGRFPVAHVYVDVTLGAKMHVGHGVTYMGRRIRMDVGRLATKDDLADDWRMTHEMFHLGFPDLDDDYLYMEEGLSTWLEPIARARLGDLTPERVWGDLVDGIPQGLPGKGDKGLDRTHTWGRTYWGGCLFWLLADVGIREKTRNAKSLDDGLRAILDAGGDGHAHWDVDGVLKTIDDATGTHVVTDLHETYGLSSNTVDLDALWKKLGVERTPTGVRFHDDAPDAAIRAAITAPRKGR